MVKIGFVFDIHFLSSLNQDKDDFSSPVNLMSFNLLKATSEVKQGKNTYNDDKPDWPVLSSDLDTR